MRALNFYLIIIGLKRVGTCCSVAPGLLLHCNLRLLFVPMFSSACGCREWLVLLLLFSNFQSWGQAQKSEMAVMFNKVIGLLGNGATVANGAGFVLSSRKLQRGEAERDCALWTWSNGRGEVGKWCGIWERVILIISHQA